MMFFHVANSRSNPFPGKLFNKPAPDYAQILREKMSMLGVISTIKDMRLPLIT